jgi:Ca2+-transporting ATPase
MNRAIIIEIGLAVLVTQMDALRRIVDTTQINLRQFGWALLPAAALLLLWEAAKLLARRHRATAKPPPIVLAGIDG